MAKTGENIRGGGKSAYRGKRDNDVKSAKAGSRTYRDGAGSGNSAYRGKRDNDAKPTGGGAHTYRDSAGGGKPAYRGKAGDDTRPTKDAAPRRSGDKPAYHGGREHGVKPAESRTRASQEAPPRVDDDAQPFLIIGRNAVKEAVKSGRSIDYILTQREPDGSLREILGLARDRKLVIRECERQKLDEVTMPFGHAGRPANHQGIVAYAAGVDYCTVGDILAGAKGKNAAPFVIVLDGVTDPNNLGSIIRSAECAGAHGLVIGKRRSASVTAAAVKAAAGAAEYLSIARVTNINAALMELRKAGLWIVGADMAGAPMDKQGLNGPLALVIGGEGTGISKLVRDNCDFLVSIPLRGQIASLNAAVAAAILMFEKNRQDAAE